MYIYFLCYTNDGNPDYHFWSTKLDLINNIKICMNFDKLVNFSTNKFWKKINISLLIYLLLQLSQVSLKYKLI